MSPSKPFKDLKAQWYKKLKESGFDDIEYPKGGLKQHDRRTQAFEIRAEIYDFFTKLGTFLNNRTNTINPEERRILELYCFGCRVKDISKTNGSSIYGIKKIIRHYKKMISSSTDNEMNVDPKQWMMRDAIPNDIPFIYNSWTTSYRHISPLRTYISDPVFYKEYLCVIDSILANPNTKTLVACSIEDREIVFGYCIYGPDLLHYMLIKEPFRRFGIAKQLYELAGKPKTASHVTNKTHLGYILMDKYKVVFNPFSLFKDHEHASKKESHG